MEEAVRLMLRMEESLKWRPEWSAEFGDARDRVCMTLWSNNAGSVAYKDRQIFMFGGWPDFRRQAEAVVEANREKSNLEKVDWHSCT